MADVTLGRDDVETVEDEGGRGARPRSYARLTARPKAVDIGRHCGDVVRPEIEASLRRHMAAN